MKTLKDLYENHFGKVSQKWAIYFNQYEEKFSKYKESPIRLFEIGIEIFCKEVSLDKFLFLITMLIVSPLTILFALACFLNSFIVRSIS